MKLQNPEEQFKIIAIRPHLDCGKKYSKILKNGRMYNFYKEYIFPDFPGIEESGDNISHYKKNSQVPSDLYSIENLQINISAIVGKNGSGKSTLIELIIYCIYILGTNLENDKDNNPLLQPYYHQLERLIAKKEKDLSFLEDEKKRFLKRVSKSQNTTNKPSIEQELDKLLELNIKQGDLEKEVKELRTLHTESVEEHHHISSNFHCSVYFELDNTVWEFNTKTFQKDKSDSPEEPSSYGIIKTLNHYSNNSQEILSSFFYSIILNYSHHALNSKFLGHWINTLFHKNDGYKTPGVINPMRTNGDFEINKEIYLSKHRLLANALIETLENETKVGITEKQYIHKVRFTFTPSDEDSDIKLGSPGSTDESDDFIIQGRINSVNLIMELMPLYFENSFEEIAVQEKNLPYSIPLINYLTRKVYKIFRNYPEYNPQDKFNNIFDLFRTALPIIKKDKSHVSFKVDRAMFFLKKNLDPNSRSKWDMSKPSIEFTLPELLEWMEIESPSQIHLIFERIPPSQFDIEFILDNSTSKKDYEKLEEKELPSLTDLSSGEQQKIHIINAVVYHLNNIYSVHRSSEEVQRLKYNYVNIIFDEIELYFHPDLQRKFINDLLSAIKRLKHITKDSTRCIKALNILFSTHSPFILSDIPSQNILSLECGDIDPETRSVPIDSQTFGANIHELLGSSFFFKERVYIGEFANNLIKDLIKTIQEYKEKPTTFEEEKYMEIKKQISIIGEPFIRKKMQEMILEIYNKK